MSKNIKSLQPMTIAHYQISISAILASSLLHTWRASDSCKGLNRMDVPYSVANSMANKDTEQSYALISMVC
jgi:hypothetical protein